MSNYANQAQGQDASGFDPASTFTSGGLNNSTGREPFEDGTSTFAPAGTSEAALAGHLHGQSGHHHHGHHGHHHESSGLSTGSGLNTSTTGTGYDNNREYSSNTGSGLNTSTTGAGYDNNREYSSNTGSGLEGRTRDNFGDNAIPGAAASNASAGQYSTTGGRGDYGTTSQGLSQESHGRAAGTASDTGVGGGREAAVAAVRQTGDHPGAHQTGTGSYGTGDNLQSGTGTQRTGTDSYSTGQNLDRERTSGNDRGLGAGGVGSGNLYGSNTAARDYDNSTSGLSEGAAGTDRFDTSKQHGVTSDTAATTGAAHGHHADDKRSDDHSASGLTRHGDDFTKGDTADSAYKNYKPTGLSGNENTTTGVHDQNLESTGAQKEGLLDKVKNVFGGHTNTTHAK